MFELSRIECGRVNDMQTRGSRGGGGGGLGEVVREGGIWEVKWVVSKEGRRNGGRGCQTMRRRFTQRTETEQRHRVRRKERVLQVTYTNNYFKLNFHTD